jgi:hypothetical protein
MYIQPLSPIEACAHANNHLANAESALRQAFGLLRNVGGQEAIVAELQAMHARLTSIVPKVKS